MPSWLRLIDVVMFVCFSEEIYSFEYFVMPATCKEPRWPKIFERVRERERERERDGVQMTGYLVSIEQFRNGLMLNCKCYLMNYCNNII